MFLSITSSSARLLSLRFHILFVFSALPKARFSNVRSEIVRSLSANSDLTKSTPPQGFGHIATGHQSTHSAPRPQPSPAPHRDALVAVVDVGAVLLPGDGGLRVPARRLALHHRWLPRRHHHVRGVLPEVVPENCRKRKKG